MIVNIICPLFIFLALYLSLFFSLSFYLLFLLLNFFFSTNLFILFINSCHSSVLSVFLTFSLFNFLLYFKILFVDQFSNSIVSPYIFFSSSSSASSGRSDSSVLSFILTLLIFFPHVFALHTA